MLDDSLPRHQLLQSTNLCVDQQNWSFHHCLLGGQGKLLKMIEGDQSSCPNVMIVY